MLQMDIKLKNISMINRLKEIDFGVLSYYILDESCVFIARNNTSLMVKELITITRILEIQNILYNVDKNYNINIKVQE